MATVYKIQLSNGRFEHVEGYDKAIERARVMACAPSLNTVTETELRQDYGVTLTRLTPSEAQAVELGKETVYGGAKTMRLPEKETREKL